jgi:hypothetical protein
MTPNPRPPPSPTDPDARAALAWLSSLQRLADPHHRPSLVALSRSCDGELGRLVEHCEADEGDQHTRLGLVHGEHPERCSCSAVRRGLDGARAWLEENPGY